MKENIAICAQMEPTQKTIGTKTNKEVNFTVGCAVCTIETPGTYRPTVILDITGPAYQRGLGVVRELSNNTMARALMPCPNPSGPNPSFVVAFTIIEEHGMFNTSETFFLI